MWDIHSLKMFLGTDLEFVVYGKEYYLGGVADDLKDGLLLINKYSPLDEPLSNEPKIFLTEIQPIKLKLRHLNKIHQTICIDGEHFIPRNKIYAMTGYLITEQSNNFPEPIEKILYQWHFNVGDRINEELINYIE